MTDTVEGALRVWWIPQVPMKPFRFSVKTPEEAGRMMSVLAQYDLFQFEHNVKPDYSNAGGLEVFTDGEWEEWQGPLGETIDEYIEEVTMALPEEEIEFG